MSLIPPIRFGATYDLDSVQMEKHVRHSNKDTHKPYANNGPLLQPESELPLDEFTRSDIPQLVVDGKAVSLHANGQKAITLDSQITSVEQFGTKGIAIKMKPETKLENGVYKLEFETPFQAETAFEELTEHHSVPPFYRKHTY